MRPTPHLRCNSYAHHSQCKSDSLPRAGALRALRFYVVNVPIALVPPEDG